MSTTTSNTQLKQIKASPAERINGKIKIQNKQDFANLTNTNSVPNGTATTTNGKPASGQQGEVLTPEQRRKTSGRPQMTTEEQRLALRKRVEQFIPTINVRNSTTNILAKYKDAAPSFIIHLHPTHFRFDQQDGVFSYNSPMKAILEYIRDEQIPHEVADIFKLARIKYYDACLIVEVRDHRPSGQPVNTTSRGGPFITPSQNANVAPARPPPAVTTPSKEPPRIYRTLLRPTEQSLWQDFGQLADTSGGEFTDWMGLQVEGGLMLAMHPRLVLDKPHPGESRKRIFERVFDCSGNIPPRKKAKRESSKAADDSAERAAEEKMMLLGSLKQDKDFQPRFQILVHRDEWKKKKTEEEKTKAANGNQNREFAPMLNINEVSEMQRVKPKVTIDSLQAQTQLATQGRLAPTTNGMAQGLNPAQLAQQSALAAAVQAQQAQGPPGGQRRLALPRVASQDQLNALATRQQVNAASRQIQSTGPAPLNAPTPMSSSPQAPISRLPATPRNVPGTPRPPGTPQPQTQKLTPQPNGQAMTPASSQPSPMLKSVSQSDEGQMQQQINGVRPFTRGGPPQPMMNGVPPQVRPQGQHPSFPIPQFMELLKTMGITISYEQFLNLPLQHQAQLTAKVQEYVQRTLQGQGNPGVNPQTVQGAYQQAQNFLQQAQRNVQMQPGQAMTPEQQRILAQTKHFLGGGDPEIIRQQGRIPPNDVQQMFQQQLLVRSQNPQQALQQQTPQQQAQLHQNFAQARQIALAQHQQQQQQQPPQQAPKLPNGQPMTQQQVQMFRARQLQAQAQARNAQNMSLPMAQFMTALSPEQRARFPTLDPQTQAGLFQNYLANQNGLQQPQQLQQLQQQQQQQQQGNGPQLQYNPMAAQNMGGAGRMPGQMVGMVGQGQPTPNGVNGPPMMRQSTSGGNA